MVSIFLTIPRNKPEGIALSLNNSNKTQTTSITNKQLLLALNRGRYQIEENVFITVHPSFRNAPKQEKLPISQLLTLVVPAATLFAAIVAFRLSEATGWDAIFPSQQTSPIVLKFTVWVTLIAVVAYEQSFYHYSSGGKNLAMEGGQSGICNNYIGVEVIVDDGYLAAQEVANDELLITETQTYEEEINVEKCMEDPSQSMRPQMVQTKKEKEITTSSKSYADPPDAKGVKSPPRPPATPTNASSATSVASRSIQPPSAATPSSAVATSAPPSPTKNAPGSIPFRFIRATKGDVAAAKERWADTLAWRAENGMDTCLSTPHPHVKEIKENYPHYFHLRGKNNECCYYEQPPKMNLVELRKAGIEIDSLLKHYAICCEFMWTHIEPSEEGKSIYVIDLDGIGFRDFAGDVVDFVKRASSFTGAHYPERSGTIFVINVPSWFSVIWNVVKPMVDDVTKKKIKILRYGKEAIFQALCEKIDVENIPPEYGGKSMPLGQSPEEIQFAKHFEALNKK